MTISPADRTAATIITASTNARRFVEYAFVPRLLLWVCWSVYSTPDEIEGDGREIAEARYHDLGMLLRAMAIPMGVREGDKALTACKAAIDSQFSQYASGKAHKKAAWVALAAYHVAGILLDEGLIPAYEAGSPMAEIVDSVVGLLTPEQIKMFDRTARKAAVAAVDGLRKAPYRLWQAPWADSPQTSVSLKILDAFRPVPAKGG